MNRKDAIVARLDREDLKWVLDQLEIDGVDRRSVRAMRSALVQAAEVTPEDLLGFFYKDAIQDVCQAVGLPTDGTRQQLIDRLLRSDSRRSAPPPEQEQEPKQEQERRHRMGRKRSEETSQPQERLAIDNGRIEQDAARQKKVEKLTLARLERLLFQACDILRGNMDASEYKEYIFGMLFLKRLSDQFERDQAKLRANYEEQGLGAELIEEVLTNPDKYDFYVPFEARWNVVDRSGRRGGISHLKQAVGSGLNKALAAVEDANPDTLQDVLKTINFNRKVGQRTMEDRTLVAFIQHFDQIPLSNEDFEFPDLLGAAYEYLIKYFADSAGKKGGEFYTPAEVVRTMVQLIEPQEGMSIYDPTAGSGGMVIQSKQYVQETGGDSRNLALAGQELNGGTWAICKMNMILHGIRSADIRQGDTLREPQHLDHEGEIRRFDRVIANPPFSQNYSRHGMKYPHRFHTFLPESGKKADLMFVQHMVASLRSNGKLAVVMPHGVLFRGGDEKACRAKFIQQGVLEAVVGLPPGLFYGTGIPACILVINKQGATARDHVLFINADREYREGKNQNSLRAEDIEKITHVYRKRLDVPHYSRNVPVGELEREGFNLNIRRYVDNSPAPEPHDVRAHLRGGVPLAEVRALNGYWDNYAGVRELLFQPRDASYCDFSPAITSKDAIKPLLEQTEGIRQKNAAFQRALDIWWSNRVAEIEKLPGTNRVFELRRKFLTRIAAELEPQGVLDLHQIRGAFAGYMKQLEADFKSVAASGWRSELIPEEEILQSQFPEVFAQIEQDRARIEELEGILAAAESAAEDEDEQEEDQAEPNESGALPKKMVKALKHELKAIKGEQRQLNKQLSELRRDAARMEGAGSSRGERAALREKIGVGEEQLADRRAREQAIEGQLARHVELEDELKKAKARIRQVERRRDELVAAARAKIGEDEARRLILERFQQLLREHFEGYLRQYQRTFIAAIENLWDKYAVTAQQLLAERDREAARLDAYLKELGYV